MDVKSFVATVFFREDHKDQGWGRRIIEKKKPSSRYRYEDLVSPALPRKKRTQPPPKENLLENFLASKKKLSRPVVDTKTL